MLFMFVGRGPKDLKKTRETDYKFCNCEVVEQCVAELPHLATVEIEDGGIYVSGGRMSIAIRLLRLCLVTM